MKALLWEIRRLRELTVESFRRGGAMLGYSEDPHQAYLTSQFAALFEREPAILESQARPSRRAPAAARTESDRAAKRAARERR